MKELEIKLLQWIYELESFLVMEPRRNHERVGHIKYGGDSSARSFPDDVEF